MKNILSDDPIARAEDDRRIAVMRECVRVVSMMLHESFGKDHNVILAMCPAGEREVSLLCSCESEIAVEGMKRCIVNTLDQMQEKVTLQ